MPQAVTWRLFIAVPLPSELKAEIDRLCGPLRTKCPFRAWVHPDDLHLTLMFIGETAPAAVPRIEERLNAIAARAYPFELVAGNIGFFGAPQSPRVLWVGVSGNVKTLRALQADVAQEMAGIGFQPEARPFSPQITLARRYAGTGRFQPERLQDVIPADGSGPSLKWTADRIVLYRSHLGRTPSYEPLRQFVFYAGG